MSLSTHSPIGQSPPPSLAKMTLLGNEEHPEALSPDDRQVPSHVRSNFTLVIEKRALIRECIVRALSNTHLDGPIVAFESVDEWFAKYRTLEGSPVVLLSTDHDCELADIKAACRKIAEITNHQVPIALLMEIEKAEYIVEVLNDGVRGCIPTKLPLGVAVEAIQLVRAGGVFIPAESLLEISWRHDGPAPANASTAVNPRQIFSERQAAVAAALQKGMANKIIAYELRMAEGTVKVHVRNIMRKLMARNRTHAAFLLNQIDARR